MTSGRYNVIYTSYRASELNHIPNIGRFNQIYLHTHTLSSTKYLCVGSMYQSIWCSPHNQYTNR